MTPIITLLLAIAADAQRGRTQEIRGRLRIPEPPTISPLALRAIYAAKQSGTTAFWVVRALMERDLTPPVQANISLEDAKALAEEDIHVGIARVWSVHPGIEQTIPWLTEQIAKRYNSYISAHSEIEGLRLGRIIIDSMGLDIDLRHFLDWYSANSPDLYSMDLEEALEMVHQWRPFSARNPTSPPRESLIGEIIEDLGDGWTAHRLSTRNQLDWEGEQQHHCVGSYASQVRSKNINIISLRKDGSPVLTIEAPINEDGEPYRFAQVKGRHNREAGAGTGFVPGEVEKLEELSQRILGESSLDPRTNPENVIGQGDDAIVAAIEADPGLLGDTRFAQLLYYGNDDFEGIHFFPKAMDRWAELASEGEALWLPPQIARHQIYALEAPTPTPAQQQAIDSRVRTEKDVEGHQAFGPSVLPKWLRIPSVTDNKPLVHLHDPYRMPPAFVQFKDEIPLVNGNTFVYVFEGLIQPDTSQWGIEDVSIAVHVRSESAVLSAEGEIIDKTEGWDDFRFHPFIQGWDPLTGEGSDEHEEHAEDEAEIQDFIQHEETDHPDTDEDFEPVSRNFAAAVRALRNELNVGSAGGSIDDLNVADIGDSLRFLEQHGISRHRYNERLQGQLHALPHTPAERIAYQQRLDAAIHDPGIPLVIAWQTQRNSRVNSEVELPEWNLELIWQNKLLASMSLTQEIPGLGIIAPCWSIKNVRAHKAGRGWGTELYACAIHLVGGLTGCGLVSVEGGDSQVSADALKVRPRLVKMGFTDSQAIFVRGDEPDHLRLQTMQIGYPLAPGLPHRLHGPGELPYDVWEVSPAMAETITAHLEA